MATRQLIKNNLNLTIPIVILFVYYVFLYSGFSFVIFNKFSKVFFYLFNKKSIPFSVFDDIWASYLLTALLFIIILSFLLLFASLSIKVKKGLQFSILLMIIIFLLYFFHLYDWSC